MYATFSDLDQGDNNPDIVPRDVCALCISLQAHGSSTRGGVVTRAFTVQLGAAILRSREVKARES